MTGFRALASAAAPTTFGGLRLGQKTQDALEAMAHEGLSLPEVAERFEIRRDNLQRTFDMPAVRARYNAIVGEIRQNAAQNAYLRIVELSKNADSEHVRADCNKWLAGVDGISPIKRVEGKYAVRHDFAGFDYPESGDVISNG